MASMTTAPVRTDAAIRESVLSELKWDPKISSPDIAVAVKDGVVTLSGFVPSYWEKDAAEKAVKRVYGVRGLANDIEVKLLSKRTDPEIRNLWPSLRSRSCKAYLASPTTLRSSRRYHLLTSKLRSKMR